MTNQNKSGVGSTGGVFRYSDAHAVVIVHLLEHEHGHEPKVQLSLDYLRETMSAKDAAFLLRTIAHNVEGYAELVEAEGWLRPLLDDLGEEGEE